MITSANEFIQLRDSNDRRAALDEASEEIWLEVILHYPEYRHWVAINKTVPLSILRQLALDPDSKVRFFVAMKRKCDHELFVLLAGDQDEAVRARVARNPNTPGDVLHRLRLDSSQLVLEALRQREAR